MNEQHEGRRRSEGRDTRQRLLAGASRVIRRDGAARLTLDAVAAEVGVSKGGVLYHFPTKDALIEALVDSVCDAFEADLDRELAKETPGKPGRALRAYVRAATTPDPAPELTAGLMAALANDPTVLERMRERFVRWQERALEDSDDPALATIVRLAADTLWLTESLGFATPQGSLRSQVVRRLMELAGESSPDS